MVGGFDYQTSFPAVLVTGLPVREQVDLGRVEGATLCFSLAGCGVALCACTPYVMFVMLPRCGLYVGLDVSLVTRNLALFGLPILIKTPPPLRGAGGKAFLKLAGV